MFGKNSIVGARHFNEIVDAHGAGALLVTSIFYTFQGEGPYTGRPAAFVRLSKCNLSCKMCDAYFEEGDVMTAAQVLVKIYQDISRVTGISDPREFARLNVGLVVTGGEPLLQMDSLVAFFKSVSSKFAWHQVETNATQNIKPLMNWVKVVASPKCLEGKKQGYLNPHPSILEHADCLKFVVSADASSPYHDIPEWAKKFKRPIYVSPMNVYSRLPAKAIAFEGVASLAERSTKDEVISFWEPGLLDQDANRRNHEYAARLAVERGYIFNLQTHLYGSMA